MQTRMHCDDAHWVAAVQKEITTRTLAVAKRACGWCVILRSASFQELLVQRLSLRTCNAGCVISRIHWPIRNTLTPAMRGVPSSYLVHIWYGKTRVPGTQCGEDRMMIESFVKSQLQSVIDGRTDRNLMARVCLT